MAWRRPGDKPLSEQMMVSLPTHIFVTRPQWVKWISTEKPRKWVNDTDVINSMDHTRNIAWGMISISYLSSTGCHTWCTCLWMNTNISCYAIQLIRPLSFQVPLLVVFVCLLMMLLIIGVSLYTDPVLMGGGLVLFLLGIPLYFLKECLGGKCIWNGAGKDDVKDLP